MARRSSAAPPPSSPPTVSLTLAVLPLCEECVEEMLRDYRREVERLREPPEPALVIKIDPVEEFLREWSELQAFGVEWVRKWLDLRDRLIEIAKVMRRFPWMADVVRQKPVSILHPYTAEVYVAKDGSEACLSLNPPKAYCVQNGAVKEVKLELEFKRYETYEEKIREVYRPKGLLAYTTAAKEYVKTTLTQLPSGTSENPAEVGADHTKYLN